MKRSFKEARLEKRRAKEEGKQILRDFCGCECDYPITDEMLTIEEVESAIADWKMILELELSGVRDVDIIDNIRSCKDNIQELKEIKRNIIKKRINMGVECN